VSTRVSQDLFASTCLSRDWESSRSSPRLESQHLPRLIIGDQRPFFQIQSHLDSLQAIASPDRNHSLIVTEKYPMIWSKSLHTDRRIAAFRLWETKLLPLKNTLPKMATRGGAELALLCSVDLELAQAASNCRPPPGNRIWSYFAQGDSACSSPVCSLHTAADRFGRQYDAMAQ
jgi:hypothetical protein